MAQTQSLPVKIVKVRKQVYTVSGDLVLNHPEDILAGDHAVLWQGLVDVSFAWQVAYLRRWTVHDVVR